MNENEKQNANIMFILAIFTSFIVPLIFYLTKNDATSEALKKIITDTLNFELTVAIVMLIVCVIPILNVLSLIVGPALWIFNLITCLNARNAVMQNQAFEYPFSFGIIK